MNHSESRTLPQVRLRAMEPEDLDMLYAMENDDSVWAVGNTSVPYSRYVLHDYIASASNDIYVDGQVRLIIESASGDAVGMIDLTNFSAAHRRAELSIVVRTDCRGHGYALAAVERLADHCKRILHMHQIYAIVEAGNQASLAMLRQAGFTAGQELHDWLFDGTDYKDARVMQYFL